MNDWGYGCLAKLLTAAMVEALTRSPIVDAGSVKHAGDQSR
jgi:hypothetical protein